MADTRGVASTHLLCVIVTKFVLLSFLENVFRVLIGKTRKVLVAGFSELFFN